MFEKQELERLRRDLHERVEQLFDREVVIGQAEEAALKLAGEAAPQFQTADSGEGGQ